MDPIKTVYPPSGGCKYCKNRLQLFFCLLVWGVLAAPFAELLEFKFALYCFLVLSFVVVLTLAVFAFQFY